MTDLVKTARRAEGSDFLPKVSFGVMNAEVLILRMADRIEELETENARLQDAQTELQAAVAAEREACAKLVSDCAPEPQLPFGGGGGVVVADRAERHARRSIAYDRWVLALSIRARTDSDAQAALEAVKREAGNEALREASVPELVEEIRRRDNPPKTGVKPRPLMGGGPKR